MLMIKFGFSFMTLSEDMSKESDGFDAVSAPTDLDSSSSSLVFDIFYSEWEQNLFLLFIWIESYVQALEPHHTKAEGPGCSPNSIKKLYTSWPRVVMDIQR